MLQGIPRWVAWVAIALACACRPDPNKPMGAPDSYTLMAPVTEPGNALPTVRRLEIKDESVQPLPRLLEEGFASEMLRTIYVAKQFLRDAVVEGRRFPGAQRPAATDTVCLLLGLDRPGYGMGLAQTASFGKPVPRPGLPWIGLAADPSRDRALVQTVSGRLAEFAAHLVATGGMLNEAAAPPRVLVDGYRMAMEVIAREWRLGTGPAGVVQYNEGSGSQRALFGDVRENRYVLSQGGTVLRSARQMLNEPGVAATVIYRMAQAKSVGARVAPESFYAQFASNRFPPGVSPAAVLGPFRNSQAKLLGAWAMAVLRGKPPRDVVDLIEAYGTAFPAERAEVVRIFVVTTYGATVQMGGASTLPKDASRTLAELTTISAQVVAGRRSLREAVLPVDGGAGAGGN